MWLKQIWLVLFLVLVSANVFADDSVMSAVDANMARMQVYMNQTPNSAGVTKSTNLKQEKDVLPVKVQKGTSNLEEKAQLVVLIKRVKLTEDEKKELINMIMKK